MHFKTAVLHVGRDAPLRRLAGWILWIAFRFHFCYGFFQGKAGAIYHRDRFDQIAAGAA